MLRRPHPRDADAVFLGWTSDDVVTRFMSWPRHRSVEDSRAFLEFSDVEWDRWPAGPYLIEARSSGVLIGSCGFTFRDRHLAEVGYILNRDAWGHGYATECLATQVELAAVLGPITLEASVHPDNHGSARVLEKCSFGHDRTSHVIASFPNLADNDQVIAARWVRMLGAPTAAQQAHRAERQKVD